ALACCPLEAPVQRNTDHMDGFAVASQRPYALGNYSFCPHLTTLAPDTNPAPLGDTALSGQLFADFNKELWLNRGVHTIVLGPVVEVLGQAVRGRHEWEFRAVAQ